MPRRNGNASFKKEKSAINPASRSTRLPVAKAASIDNVSESTIVFKKPNRVPLNNTYVVEITAFIPCRTQVLAHAKSEEEAKALITDYIKLEGVVWPWEIDFLSLEEEAGSISISSVEAHEVISTDALFLREAF